MVGAVTRFWDLPPTIFLSRPTAPAHWPWAQVRDDAAYRRRQPAVHCRACAYRPAQDLGRAGPNGPIRAAVDVLVEPVTDSRARLTISVDFTGHGIGKILVPLMVRREARKEMPDNMAALKQRV